MEGRDRPAEPRWRLVDPALPESASGRELARETQWRPRARSAPPLVRQEFATNGVLPSSDEDVVAGGGIFVSVPGVSGGDATDGGTAARDCTGGRTCSLGGGTSSGPCFGGGRSVVGPSVFHATTPPPKATTKIAQMAKAYLRAGRVAGTAPDCAVAEPRAGFRGNVNTVSVPSGSAARAGSESSSALSGTTPASIGSADWKRLVGSSNNA